MEYNFSCVVTFHCIPFEQAKWSKDHRGVIGLARETSFAHTKLTLEQAITNDDSPVAFALVMRGVQFPASRRRHLRPSTRKEIGE